MSSISPAADPHPAEPRPDASLPRWALPLLLALFALLATISSVVVPPFETPDEIWHFAFIQQLATGGGLPVSGPQTEALWRQQGTQTPGYYLAAAALTFWIDQRDFPELYARKNPYAAIGGGADLLNRAYLLHYLEEGWPWRGSILALHIARFFSVFLSVVTLWASFQALRLLVPERVALLGVALFAFIPQFVFISGAASNDNAINAVAALMLWRLILLLQSPVPASTRDLLLLGFLLGLALLSKISGLWLVLMTVGVLGVVAHRARSWHVLGRGLLLIGGVAALLSGWWFVRNLQLYGDPMATNIWLANIGLRNRPATWRTLVFSEWESLDHSFWGLFGWFNVTYPVWLYRIFQLLELLIVLGLLLALFRVLRARRAHATLPWPGLLLLALWLVALIISWAGFFRLAPAAQGRYFFPAAPTLALGMVVGLSAWRWRPTQPPLLAWGVALVLFTLSLVTPWWLIRPAYQPSAPLTELPADATPLNVQFGDAIRLEGYTVTPRQIAPSTPMELTLYWRALRPMEEFWSVAVKGFGRAHDGPLIARDDSYPDAGRWPTPLWEPGQIIADRWRIWISGQTITPTLARLTVDLYPLDAATGEPGAMLAATVDGQPVPLPFHFTDLIVREPGATPVPPATFAFRPVPQGVTLTDTSAVELSFTWEVGQALSGDYHAFFHLVADPDEPPVAQNDFAPLGDLFPTPHWWPGDRLPDRAVLPLPTDLPPGDYTLLLGLYDLATLQRAPGEGAQSAWEMARLTWDGEAWHVTQ